MQICWLEMESDNRRQPATTTTSPTTLTMMLLTVVCRTSMSLSPPKWVNTHLRRVCTHLVGSSYHRRPKEHSIRTQSRDAHQTARTDIAKLWVIRVSIKCFEKIRKYDTFFFTFELERACVFVCKNSALLHARLKHSPAAGHISVREIRMMCRLSLRSSKVSAVVYGG